MSTTIPGFTPTIPPASTSTVTTGSNTLSSTDFMNVMLAQLQQQDPLNPTDSNQMLTQMSEISTLQSNQALTTNLQGLTLQQSIASGSSMMGKTVLGTDAQGNSTGGTVTSVKVVNQSVMLELNSGGELPLSGVTQILPAGTTITGTTGTTGTTGATTPTTPTAGA
jgi:flagellar basal-body rod modification protein FlgD